MLRDGVVYENNRLERCRIMLLTNKTYNILKWVAQYLLPASGTLYFALASIWGLPHGEQIIGTVTAVDIFLGVILGLSANQYNKTAVVTDGQLLIDTSNPTRDTYRLDLGENLEGLSSKKTITLAVKENQILTPTEE